MSDLLEKTKPHTFKEFMIFKGVIEGAIEGVKQRYCIMETSHWKIVYSTMAKLLGESTNSVIGQIGEEYGKAVSKFVQEKFKTDPTNTFLYILQNMEKLGWGAFWNVKVQPAANKIELELHNSLEAYNTGIASCYHVKGILRGIAKGILGDQIEVRETKCVAKGDRVCEFTIGTQIAVPELYSKEILEILTKILQELKHTIKSSVELLATTDGVPILSPDLAEKCDPTLWSTIISYVICGGKEGSQAINNGNLKEIIINAEQGTIIASQCTKNTVVAAVISPDSSPGLAGLALKKAKDKIIELLK